MHVYSFKSRNTCGAVNNVAFDRHFGYVVTFERAVNGEELHMSAITFVGATALVLTGATDGKKTTYDSGKKYDSIFHIGISYSSNIESMRNS